MLNLKSASFCNLAFATSGLGKHILAVVASNDRLRMAEDHICFTASTALDIHEVRVRGGDESFQLVGISFLLDAWVKEVSVHRC